MKHVIREAKVPFKPHQIFDLVNDTESYPKFVPYCTQGAILRDDGHERLATLTFGYHGVTQTIKTHNTMTPYERIQVSLVDGPLSFLEGCWTFESLPHESGCIVKVEFKYEITSSWISMAFEPILLQVLQQMVDCFTEEAEQRYGTV